VLSPQFSFTFSTFSIFAADIRSIRFIGGSADFPNSVFYDNLRVTDTIPEPTTLLLLGTGREGVAAPIKSRQGC